MTTLAKLRVGKIRSVSEFANLNIGARLVLGFSAIGLILVAAVGITQSEVSKADGITTRIVESRVPAAFASGSMAQNITASMASLRGWVLTGNPEFKTERAAIWAEIAEMRAEIDRLSVDWSNADHIAEWDRFKSVIDEFAVVQKQVEDVANTPDQLPATKILLEEAAPAAEEIIAEIGKVIEIEKKQTASRERRRLLAAMADIASTTSMAFSDIRAYLLTGDEKDRESHLKNWKKNEQSFGDLSMMQHLFTREQSASLTKLVTLRGNFKRLPSTMFEIRGSEKWDLADFLLVTEVSPRADQLLDILLGAKNEDGSRTGGLVGAQEDLLTQDAQISVESASRLRLIKWGLLFAGLGNRHRRNALDHSVHRGARSAFDGRDEHLGQWRYECRNSGTRPQGRDRRHGQARRGI